MTGRGVSRLDELDALRAENEYLREQIREMRGHEHGSEALPPVHARFVALIRRAGGRTVSGEAILAGLYDHPDETPALAYLRQLAHRVRSRCPEIGRYIETVRGVGYRWRAEQETADRAESATGTTGTGST